jgi:hypothetical protein
MRHLEKFEERVLIPEMLWRRNLCTEAQGTLLRVRL